MKGATSLEAHCVRTNTTDVSYFKHKTISTVLSRVCRQWDV